MQEQITELLRRMRNGDASASDELMPVVYQELHRIARSRLRRERPDHTLQPTALVHEAYVKMFEHTGPAFQDRAHFMAVASRIMRQILVDYARARGSVRRGGQDRRVAADIEMAISGESGDQFVHLLDLDRALSALAESNPAPAEAVELRYFGGLTAEETAAVVRRSVHIVQHELRFAHAWLRRRLATADS